MESEMSQTIELADRLEIAELFARLARLLDEGQPEDIRRVYSEDVEVHSPRSGELRGIGAVIEFLGRSRGDAERTQHTNSDVLVTVDGDRIEASAHQLVHYYRPDQPPHRRSGLRLVYSVTRTSQGWRFQKGQLTLLWSQVA
jgi:SnoaL-like domain